MHRNLGVFFIIPIKAFLVKCGCRHIGKDFNVALSHFIRSSMYIQSYFGTEPARGLPDVRKSTSCLSFKRKVSTKTLSGTIGSINTALVLVCVFLYHFKYMYMYIYIIIIV